MNLNDAKKRIQAYLCSNKTWPLLVDVQTKSDKSEIIDYFKVGENTFPDIESFCNDDGDLKVDELYAAVSANVGNTFITNVTGFLKLHGELATKRALKTLATSGISGHVVVLTYQCKCYSNLNHTSAAYTTPPATGVLPLCTRLRRVRRNNPPWRSL